MLHNLGLTSKPAIYAKVTPDKTSFEVTVMPGDVCANDYLITVEEKGSRIYQNKLRTFDRKDIIKDLKN